MMKTVWFRILVIRSLFFLPLFACGGVAVAQGSSQDSVAAVSQDRLNEVFDLIRRYYVESPDMQKISEEAINAMLKALDPHSVYITADDVQNANEPLQGNFEGVGITFQVVSDTIHVSDVIDGGPAEKVGILPGDKIVRIDGRPAVGDSVNNSFVTKHLRGKKGTVVVVDMLRDGKELSFHITRDKIPLYSVDTYFMATDDIGYIRLARFARTSVVEFRNAVKDLRGKGMKRLIFDLRGNSGGFLEVACGIANEFLARGRLIVYTDGRSIRKEEFHANGSGALQESEVIVLIDEYSASASEIVSGALQDWDRATLIGRRTFGKGLVQRMFSLHDGGQVRLTTARYYTPSGRCIQKPYDNGADDYQKDLNRRYNAGEYVSADSIHLPDSLKYHTAGGRVVYGGGGIMPDMFVPMDTMKLSDFYIAARSKGLVNNFPLGWVEKHRHDASVKDYDAFVANYDRFGIDAQFEKYAVEHGVERDKEKEAAEPERIAHSNRYQSLILKALVARNLFGSEYYYRVMCSIDETYQRALSVLVNH